LEALEKKGKTPFGDGNWPISEILLEKGYDGKPMLKYTKILTEPAPKVPIFAIQFNGVG